MSGPWILSHLQLCPALLGVRLNVGLYLGLQPEEGVGVTGVDVLQRLAPEVEEHEQVVLFSVEHLWQQWTDPVGGNNGPNL